MGAIQQTDHKAKASALEAFSVQYPNSVMKVSTLEQLMGTYLQLQDQAKVVDAAKRLLAADPVQPAGTGFAEFLCHDRAPPPRRAPRASPIRATYSSKGLECLATAQKTGDHVGRRLRHSEEASQQLFSTAAPGSLACRARTTSARSSICGPPSRESRTTFRTFIRWPWRI